MNASEENGFTSFNKLFHRRSNTKYVSTIFNSISTFRPFSGQFIQRLWKRFRCTHNIYSIHYLYNYINQIRHEFCVIIFSTKIKWTEKIDKFWCFREIYSFVYFNKNFILRNMHCDIKKNCFALFCFVICKFFLVKIFTLNSWTPITANINWRRYVTNIILPIVLMATITHFTTYWGRFGSFFVYVSVLRMIWEGITNICVHLVSISRYRFFYVHQWSWCRLFIVCRFVTYVHVFFFI